MHCSTDDAPHLIYCTKGAACALALAQAGATVCLAVRPSSTPLSEHPALAPLKKAVPELQHVAVECDLSDLASVRTTFERALAATGGKIDILVNCGGIQRRSPATEFPESDWDEVSRAQQH